MHRTDMACAPINLFTYWKVVLVKLCKQGAALERGLLIILIIIVVIIIVIFSSTESRSSSSSTVVLVGLCKQSPCLISPLFLEKGSLLV